MDQNPPPADSEEVLKRLGTSPESAARLARKAEDAEQILGIHGVSVTAGKTVRPAGAAARAEVEKQFRVHDTPTRADRLHRTVELPKAVSVDKAALFNRLFGRRGSDS
jgi:hypothetical protein